MMLQRFMMHFSNETILEIQNHSQVLNPLTTNHQLLFYDLHLELVKFFINQLGKEASTKLTIL